MQVIVDLIVIFVALGLTYIAARLWQQNASRLHEWLPLVGQRVADRNATSQSVSTGKVSDCGHPTFQIAFEISGISVDPSRLKHKVSKALLGTIHASVQKRARNVRCPQHGTAPRILVTGESLGDLSWDAPGCCPALQAALRQTLGNAMN